MRTSLRAALALLLAAAAFACADGSGSAPPGAKPHDVAEGVTIDESGIHVVCRGPGASARVSIGSIEPGTVVLGNVQRKVVIDGRRIEGEVTARCE
jgi:hypothetical protein